MDTFVWLAGWFALLCYLFGFGVLPILAMVGCFRRGVVDTFRGWPVVERDASPRLYWCMLGLHVAIPIIAIGMPTWQLLSR